MIKSSKIYHLNVALGTFVSKNPNKVVGNNGLEAQFWEIYVEVVKVDNKPLIWLDGEELEILLEQTLHGLQFLNKLIDIIYFINYFIIFYTNLYIMI